MDKVTGKQIEKRTGKLTIFFEKPFWVGVFEQIENGKLSVVKVTFGSEPKNQEVYDFISKSYYDLQFSPDVTAVLKEMKKNPKRIQRDIKKQLQDTGIGTKSQQALKLQHEQFKIERKKRSRKQKEAEAEKMFKLKQQKKKDKHRGH